VFYDIEDVPPYQKLKDLPYIYKKLAGFSVEELNELPLIIRERA
jgi:hypothetical protein